MGRNRYALQGIAATIVILAGAGFVRPEPAHAASWFDRLRETLTGSPAEETVLSSEEIGRGLKEALQVATDRVVAQLGSTDGFNLDPEIHIPLPRELDRVRSALAAVGMASTLDDLEVRLNRAAEQATPKAKALFLGAIQQMTFEDVMGIYQGPDDAATQYFKGQMAEPLAEEMTPIVEDSLADVGVLETYDAVMAEYNALPFVPKVDADLREYVVEKGIDGIFFYVAKEEAAIREDPAKRTTDLLKRVFGGAGGN